MAAVVVGVDGTEASHAALRLAVHEARLRGLEVRAVHVWHVPVSLYLAGSAPTEDECAAYEAEARAVLDAAIAELGADAEGVSVTPVLCEAPATAAPLVREAEMAELLVLGSRGVGPVRELLGTSVSHTCVHRAACPVLVVPPHEVVTAAT